MYRSILRWGCPLVGIEIVGAGYPVAAMVFGVVEGSIGKTDQLLPLITMIGKSRDTERSGHDW